MLFHDSRRLHGSYEALHGGWTDDALVDLTGGIGQRIHLKEADETELWKELLHDFQMNSLLGASIYVSASAYKIQCIPYC